MRDDFERVIRQGLLQEEDEAAGLFVAASHDGTVVGYDGSESDPVGTSGSTVEIRATLMPRLPSRRGLLVVGHPTVQIMNEVRGFYSAVQKSGNKVYART